MVIPALASMPASPLEEQAAVLRRYRQGLPPAGEFTRGLSYRGVGGPSAGGK